MLHGGTVRVFSHGHGGRLSLASPDRPRPLALTWACSQVLATGRTVKQACPCRPQGSLLVRQTRWLRAISVAIGVVIDQTTYVR